MGKIKDETGNVYGRLTVIRAAGVAKGGYARWHCRCECGNETDVYGTNLRTGSTKSCGCQQRKPAIDETGNKYGKLTVLGRAEDGKLSGAYWNCQCDCGKKAKVFGIFLRGGDTRSCGCLRLGQGRKVKDKTGETYGRLTVIRRAKNKGKHIYWVCQCGCGKVVEIAGNTLCDSKTRERRSCGCLRGKLNRLPAGEAGFRSLLRSYKQGAKGRDLHWNLTEEQFRILTKGNCHYCNKSPSQVQKNSSSGDYTYNGIDRKDNDIGYLPDNSVSCCTRCNYLKNSRSYEDFLTAIKEIAAYRCSLVEEGEK